METDNESQREIEGALKWASIPPKMEYVLILAAEVRRQRERIASLEQECQYKDEEWRVAIYGSQSVWEKIDEYRLEVIEHLKEEVALVSKQRDELAKEADKLEQKCREKDEKIEEYQNALYQVYGLHQKANPNCACSICDIMEDGPVSPESASKTCKRCGHPRHGALCWEVKNEKGVATCPCSDYVYEVKFEESKP